MSDTENAPAAGDETTPAPEPTTEAPEPSNPDQPDDIEDLRKRANAFEDQKRRAEIAEAELKQLKGGKKENQPAPNKGADDRIARAEERAARAELMAAGVTHPDDRQFVTDAAKRLGVDPIDAVNDPIVSAKLKQMRDDRATKAATPGASKGGTTTTNIARLAEKALSTGEFPTDPDLKAKVKEYMRKNK